MANRDFKNVQCLDREIKVITGVINLTASTGVVSSVEGVGFTAARTGTGAYRITLSDKYVSLRGANLTFNTKGNATILAAVIDGDDVDGATPYVDFLTVDDAFSAADTGDTSAVHLSLELKNSTVV